MSMNRKMVFRRSFGSCLISIASLLNFFVVVVHSSNTTLRSTEGKFVILKQVKHDRSSYTQGLTWDGKRLFESSGLYGKSNIRQVNPKNGAVMKKSNYPDTDFAEGITMFEDEEGKKWILGITWQEQNGYIYNPDTLTVTKTFEYETSTSEGWGVTYNKRTKEFIVSDGSEWLHFWDRDSLEEKRRVRVEYTQEGTTKYQDYLNELEYVYNGNFLLANVWLTDRIIKINISTGNIVQTYDMSSLARPNTADVLNGISITNVRNEYWMTGKLWSTMYCVKLLA
jgi:glutaminyl-peptide cyclotransferase